MYSIDIKEFRRVNKIKQTELAEYLGIARSFLSQIEAGGRPLPQVYVSKILANDKHWDVSVFAENMQTDARLERSLKIKTTTGTGETSVLVERKVLDILSSQQETIRNQSETLMEQARLISRLLDQSGIKKEDALQEDPAECADALGA